MVRYLGPKFKKLRRFGSLPGLKILPPNFKKNVGMDSQVKKFSKKSTPYGLRLNEKQKLRYNYGISEIQLFKYVQKIQFLFSKTPFSLLRLIELRLDVIVYSLGFTLTIASARQLINHGKICVNFKKVTIASFNCKRDDFISLILTQKQKDLQNFNSFSVLPAHLMRLNNFCGKIKTERISTLNFSIYERLVLEYYSKR